MKRFLALVLAVLTAFALISCSKPEDKKEDSKPDKQTETGEMPNVVDKVSSDRFSDDELLFFEGSDGKIAFERDTNAVFAKDGALELYSFFKEEPVKHEDVDALFGIRVGDALDEFLEAYSVDPGFGIYLEDNGREHNFEEGYDCSVREGGYGSVYLGYGRDTNTGEWGFMDAEMLKTVIMGKAMMMTGAYDVILVSCHIDENLIITDLFYFYGEINNVMEYIN